MSTDSGGRIQRHPEVVVVGIDGSPNSAAALRWATRYARMADAQLRAVIAWQGEMAVGLSYAPLRSNGLFADVARLTVEDTVHKVLGSNPAIAVTTKVLEGNPTAVLIDESRDADLLVVGDRGRDGFAGLLLGHVGENCARSAHCSVIVVRDDGGSP